METAFLNAPLKENVYIRCPEGYQLGNEMVLKLDRALYGLVQAPRAWTGMFCKSLANIGCMRSKSDPCLLTMKDQGRIILAMTVYVDDCLIVGQENEVEDLINKIRSVYEIKDLGEATKYLGYEMLRNREKGILKIHQSQYIRDLQRKYKIDCAGVKTPEGTKEMKIEDEETDIDEYQSLVGSLLYASKSTRPDISNAIRGVARYMTNPKKGNVDNVYRIAQYLTGYGQLGITYDKKKGQVLEAYVDSNFADKLDQRKSVTGYVIMFGGGCSVGLLSPGTACEDLGFRFNVPPMR